ncbi:sialidase family protein [Paracidobacterium acidisoli]|uniref:Glycosyl hydrolase n=1 Tax=Paracidobacterium acidisoli TaxID=2303751 RepID=A0A372ILC0_9BACT|nr:sialidase family protein [Paracidobacterium acidisoli]MBT9332341.1 exo-alpha-sialidase [Paracidobacterium acidisoli]
MSKKILRLAILCSLAAASCFATDLPKTVYQLADGIVRPSRLKGAQEAYMPLIVNSNHAANLLALPNGDLLCFWYAGIYERGDGESIVMSRLDHGSKQWTRPVIVSNHPGWANQNPVAFLAPDGRIWLFHTTQLAGHSQKNDLVWALISADQGHTWSTPQTTFPNPGMYLRQPLVIFHGQWLFPVYHSAGGSITSNAQNDVSYVEISKDSGKTWKECEIPDSGGEVQMNIIRLSEDRLIAFFRSRYADWIYQSESADGCQWSAPVAAKLPNNNASIQAVRLADGHLVMVFNNAQATLERGKAQTAARRILSVALSIDGGKTWPWIRDLENQETQPSLLPLEDPEYSYPSVTQSKDGMIQVAYTFRRETIKYMAFPEEWIKHGTTEGGKTSDIHSENVALLELPQTGAYPANLH